MTEKQVIDFCNFHESYVSKYIQQADVKAGAVFAASAGMLGYFLSKNEFLSILKFDADCWAGVISWATAGLLATAAGLAFLVIAPRRASSGGDLVFWKSVACIANGQEFSRRLKNSTPDQLAENRAVHCFDLAKVCAKKYEVLLRSIRVAGVAVILAAVSMFALPLQPVTPATAGRNEASERQTPQTAAAQLQHRLVSPADTASSEAASPGSDQAASPGAAQGAVTMGVLGESGRAQDK